MHEELIMITYYTTCAVCKSKQLIKSFLPLPNRRKLSVQNGRVVKFYWDTFVHFELLSTQLQFILKRLIMTAKINYRLILLKYLKAFNRRITQFFSIFFLHKINIRKIPNQMQPKYFRKNILRFEFILLSSRNKLTISPTHSLFHTTFFWEEGSVRKANL